MCFEHDDGYPEFADDRAVVARKAHRCGECREAIAPGDSYERHSGKYDGGFYVRKICRRCCYDRNRVVEHELAEGCDWGEAWPPFDGLVDHLIESELGQTKPEDVPGSFRVGDPPRKLGVTA